MTPRVTVSRVCAVRGDDVSGRRRQAAYCSNACRQKAYRRRGTVTLTVPANGNGLLRLDAEIRAWLRREVDRRSRERLAARLKRDAELFREAGA